MLFGVTVDCGEDRTEFLTVCADSPREASDIAAEKMTETIFSVAPLEELLYEQYRGVAKLGT